MARQPKKPTNNKKPAPAKKGAPVAKSAQSDLPAGYPEFLSALIADIRSAQLRAAQSVNRELVLLYWRIGQDILTRQRSEGWGAKVVDRLGRDLQTAFPGVAGFSTRNLKYMRAFAEAWPDREICAASAAQIPWFHNVVLLEKLHSAELRLWYAHKAVEHGWSRAVLVHQIDLELHARQGKAVTNFDRTLPPPQSDLARQALKDPYVFDFLGLTDEAEEREVERGLLNHLKRFFLELGAGFALVGSQYPLAVGTQDFYLDLLFYHLKLRCFVVIELKAVAFQPEFAGKMNFYLSAVDDLLRHPDDRPTIGLVLCKGKDRVVAEYALRGVNQPIGVSGYEVYRAGLPPGLRDCLPPAARIEDELRKAADD